MLSGKNRIQTLILIFVFSVIALTAGYVLFSINKQKTVETQELLLNWTDLQELRIAQEGECQTDYGQTTIYGTPLPQYITCNYSVNSLNNTKKIVELKRFANIEERDNTYGYDSSHLYGARGIISENTYGDKSKLRINSEDDFGYLPTNVTYYHLWICKGLYLIHITSSGDKEARGYVESIGQRILLKFEQ